MGSAPLWKFPSGGTFKMHAITHHKGPFRPPESGPRLAGQLSPPVFNREPQAAAF